MAQENGFVIVDPMDDSLLNGMDVLERFRLELILIGKELKKLWEGVSQKLFEHIQKQMKKLAASVSELFQVGTLQDYYEGAAIYGQALADELSHLTKSFGELRYAAAYAAAPLVQMFVPVVQAVADSLKKLFYSIGQVLWALTGGKRAVAGFGESLSGAAASGKNLSRSLAGFDQITRLGRKNSGVTAQIGFELLDPGPVSQELEKIISRLKALLEPLKHLDFGPLNQSLQNLKTAMEPLKQNLFDGLAWAIANVFVPLATWTVENLLPTFLNTVALALQGLNSTIETLKPGFLWMWDNFLQPLTHWVAEQPIAYLQQLGKELSTVSGFVEKSQAVLGPWLDKGREILEFLMLLSLRTTDFSTATHSAGSNFQQFMLSAQTAASPLSKMNEAVSKSTKKIGELSLVFEAMKMSSSTTFGQMTEVWGGMWGTIKKKALDPALYGVKGSFNGIISLVNMMFRAIADGINGLSWSVSKLGFEVPGWVPAIGGKKLSLSMGTVTAPTIPYLARGAVLPANKPFLAMLGDQKHGTNVEAPLATIQEAVANVMADQLGGMMAGFEAVTSRQERILQAILGLDLSDGALAGAVSRYEGRIAAVTGGLV